MRKFRIVVKERDTKNSSAPSVVVDTLNVSHMTGPEACRLMVKMAREYAKSIGGNLNYYADTRPTAAEFRAERPQAGAYMRWDSAVISKYGLPTERCYAMIEEA